MKIYILQEDYTETDPEAYWDEESGGYEPEEYECRDIRGVFTTLEAAVDKMVEIVKNSDGSFSYGRNRMDGYKIYVCDTDTSKVNIVPSSAYCDMFKSKELGLKVETMDKKG